VPTAPATRADDEALPADDEESLSGHGEAPADDEALPPGDGAAPADDEEGPPDDAETADRAALDDTGASLF
jgi:hypothetical protein